MPTSRQFSFAAGCFIAAGLTLWNDFSAFPSENSANHLLSEQRAEAVDTIQGELRPLNLKGATLQNARRGFVVVTASGEKVSVRCVTHNWRSKCFDALPGGAPLSKTPYRVTVASFAESEKIKEARVLVELADERGAVVLNKHEVLLAARGLPSTTTLLLAAIFAVAGAVGLAVPWKPVRGRTQDTGDGWFPPNP